MSSLSKPEWQAQVIEWNTEKGYGWLRWQDKKVFLHRREYSGPDRIPKLGEQVRFILGHDAKGRPCATQAVSTRRSSSLLRRWISLLLLIALMVLPAVALRRLPFERWQVAACALIISVITYITYSSDKRRARTQSWRVPEAHLHFLEMLGGWPGAWIAQIRLRHKCSKASYQFAFWIIILFHQFVAFDYIQNWHFSRSALQAIYGASQGETSPQRSADPRRNPRPRSHDFPRDF